MKTLWLVWVLLFSPVLAGASEAPSLGLPNEAHPLPGVTTGGVPDRTMLEAAVAQGYRTVVDLRSDAERDPALAELVAELGLELFAIAIAGPDDLDRDAVTQLGVLLADSNKRPMIIHCASGNRVGALLALEAHEVEGLSAADALARGLAGGLTRLEPAVRERLGLPPLPPPPPTPPSETTASPPTS
jgi:protein tyrosine phosphatase (PTP) superfamily phosphohydrolase (DUF442 family)